jgi:hypothetical protein
LYNYLLAVSEGKINIDNEFCNLLDNMLSTSILTFCLLSFVAADDVVNLINPYWARPGGNIAGSYAASVVGAVRTRACPTILLSNETYRMQQRPLMLWAASPTRRLPTLFLCLSGPIQTLMFAKRVKTHRRPLRKAPPVCTGKSLMMIAMEMSCKYSSLSPSYLFSLYNHRALSLLVD